MVIYITKSINKIIFPVFRILFVDLVMKTSFAVLLYFLTTGTFELTVKQGKHAPPDLPGKVTPSSVVEQLTYRPKTSIFTD